MNILHNNHWVSSTFKQRMTIRQWRRILLNNEDKITFNGFITQLVAKNIGSGVVEVSKALKEKK